MDQRVRVNVDKMKMAQAELDQISVNRQDIEVSENNKMLSCIPFFS